MDTFVNNSSSITQDITLIVDGTIKADGDCNISNVAVIEALSESIAELVVDQVFKTVITNSGDVKATQTTDQTGGNLSDSASISAIVGAISFVIIIVIAIVFLKKTAGGGKVSPAPAQAAQNPAQPSPTETTGTPTDTNPGTTATVPTETTTGTTAAAT